MPPAELIFPFSHSYFRHWERGEGRFILLGLIIQGVFILMYPARSMIRRQNQKSAILLA